MIFKKIQSRPYIFRIKLLSSSSKFIFFVESYETREKKIPTEPTENSKYILLNKSFSLFQSRQWSDLRAEANPSTPLGASDCFINVPMPRRSIRVITMVPVVANHRIRIIMASRTLQRKRK